LQIYHVTATIFLLCVMFAALFYCTNLWRKGVRAFYFLHPFNTTVLAQRKRSIKTRSSPVFFPELLLLIQASLCKSVVNVSVKEKNETDTQKVLLTGIN